VSGVICKWIFNLVFINGWSGIFNQIRITLWLTSGSWLEHSFVRLYLFDMTTCPSQDTLKCQMECNLGCEWLTAILIMTCSPQPQPQPRLSGGRGWGGKRPQLV